MFFVVHLLLLALLKVRQNRNYFFLSQCFLQKMNKWIQFYYYETCFCSFLEEIEDTKKTFWNHLTFKRMLDYQNYQGLFFWNFCKSKSFDLDDFKWSESKVKIKWKLALMISTDIQSTYSAFWISSCKVKWNIHAKMLSKLEINLSWTLWFWVITD